MKITLHNTHNPNVKIIEPLGELTGNGALELQNYLYTCLDEGKHNLLINLKHVKNIDSLGIIILEHFVNRGIHFRLFNAGTDIRSMLRISGKESILSIYNETDCDKVASLFEKEILGKKDKGGIKNRRHPRINTFFPADFKYNPGHNGVISCKANILNLSEGGALADQILAIDAKKGEITVPSEIAGQELYGLRFELNGGSGFIETIGKCVREFKKGEKLSAGIRFKGMKKDYKKMIRDYV